jgi:3-oxoacyl-[acyl-carrier-protein] synthase III
MLLSKDSASNTILSISQRSNMALWDTSHMEQQILATYFPMATRAILKALEDAHLTPDDITWFIPHNVSTRSWLMLSQLVPFTFEKVWLHNVSRIGHTVSCDHIINLSDMEDAGLLKKDDILFFFTFGFGAHWSSMIVQR